MKRLTWFNVVPPVAVLVLAACWGRELAPIPLVLVGLLLAAAVLAAVHHAEVVAHRVGEPFGSLVLAIAVTVIEVSLIVTLMLQGGDKAATLARDTVFAAVMITVNGILGLSVIATTKRDRVGFFNAEGTGAALATTLTLATVCLVLPRLTSSAPGPQFSSTQLAFAALASVVLYGSFVLTQTVRHRDFFLPVDNKGQILPDDTHADPPSNRQAWASLALLLTSLIAVVGLAKTLSPAIESAVESAGLPSSFVGVVIALLVLLPETLAAWRAARGGRLQTSFNLAMGSAMASIGLTIPCLAVASIWISGPLHLGLGSTQVALLAVTAVVAALTVVPGRVVRLQGIVHLTLFAAFLVISMNP